MSGPQKVKRIIDTLPQIARYGSLDIMLEAFIKPEIKISMPSAIKMLKRVAFHHKIISLSANQIGLDQRCFVALKPQLMKFGKWKNYGEQFQKFGVKTPEDAYQAIINPTEINSTYQQYYAYQQCPSFQGFKFKAKSPIFVNLRYITEKVFNDFLNQNPISKNQTSQKSIASQVQPNKQAYDGNMINIPADLYTTQKIFGFRGRVWDHENRHLNGVLVIEEEICNTQFYLLDQYKDTISSIATYEQLLEKSVLGRKENIKKMMASAKKQKMQRMKYSKEVREKGKLLQDFGGSGFPQKFLNIPQVNPEKAKIRQMNNAEIKKPENIQTEPKIKKINKHNQNTPLQPLQPKTKKTNKR